MKRWITNYEKDMSFDEFKSKLGIENKTGNKYKKKSIDEVKSDVNDILRLQF